MACSREEKAKFLDSAVNHTSTLFNNFEIEGFLTLIVHPIIVDVIIGDLIFNHNDKSAHSTDEGALAVFVLIEDAAVVRDGGYSAAREQDLDREAYRVKIESVRIFKMVLGFIAKWISFRGASGFVNLARTICKAG